MPAAATDHTHPRNRSSPPLRASEPVLGPPQPHTSLETPHPDAFPFLHRRPPFETPPTRIVCRVRGGSASFTARPPFETPPAIRDTPRHSRTPPPFENAKIPRTAPGCAGTLPRLLHQHRIRRCGMPPLFGRRARTDKDPMMTAAHSGTPAAVFVCQRTHSTANLRQIQYPYPGTRKIFLPPPGSCAEGRRNCASSRRPPPARPPCGRIPGRRR